MNHPLFGAGLNDWDHPAWMPPSVDNFWLYQAIRHGIPSPILLSLAFFSIFLAVAFKKDLDDRLVEYRTGYLITMSFFFLVGWTVHFWGPAYILFIFLMGSGVWILDVQPARGAKALAKDRSGAAVRSSRGSTTEQMVSKHGPDGAAGAPVFPARPPKSRGWSVDRLGHEPG